MSADSIVPGSASGAGGGAATLGVDSSSQLKALTVDFHEPGFVSTVNGENRLRFWFQLGDDEREHAGSPWGPNNPQALNRYSYTLNNPLRYTDPTGHTPNCKGTVVRGVIVGVCGGGTVYNESSQPVEVTGDRVKEGCTGSLDECTETVTVILAPGESSETYGLIDTDFVRAVDENHPIAGYGPDKTYKLPGSYVPGGSNVYIRDDGKGGLSLLHVWNKYFGPPGEWLDTKDTNRPAPINPPAIECEGGHRC